MPDINVLKDYKKSQELLGGKVTVTENKEISVQRRDESSDDRISYAPLPETGPVGAKARGRPKKVKANDELTMGATVAMAGLNFSEEGQQVVDTESCSGEGDSEDYDEVVEVVYGFISNEYTEKDEPMLFSGPDKEGWLESNSLEKLKVTCTDNMKFVPLGEKLPSKAVPIVLLYCRKRPDVHGFSRFKCRAVVLGNLLSCTVPSYAPVISLPGVRLIITEAVANARNGEEAITLFDISTAFLNAPLDERIDGTITVKLPESWARSLPSRYAVLKRALYGLKVSPRRWFDCVHGYMATSLGWQDTGANCVYWKIVEGVKLWLTLYVDDVVVAGGSTKLRESECSRIFAKFPGSYIRPKVSACGSLHTYDVNGICLEIDWKKRTYLMHMDDYIQKTLKKFGLENCKTATHPRVNIDLVERDNRIKSDFPVRECLGALIWLSTTCRPDVCYDVSVLARYVGTHGATKGTADAAKKVLRYLAGSPRRGIVYSPLREERFQSKYRRLIIDQCRSNDYGHVEGDPSEFSKKIFLFSDASFASCPVSLRSQTGLAVFYRGVLVAYKTMRQGVLTHCTMHSEFVACSDLQDYLVNLDPYLRLFDPPEIDPAQFVDNEPALRVARGTVLNNASKHLKLRYMKVGQAQRKLFYCPTGDQQGDPFTKSLGEQIYSMMSLLESIGD